MISKEKIHINNPLVDHTLTLKVQQFFLLFQDIAGKNAELIGSGKEATTDKGWDWVVTRFVVNFLEPVNYGSDVELFTFPAGMKSGFIFYRNGGINSLDGKPLIRISSMWNIMDNKTRRLVLKPNLPYYGDDFGEEFELPEKIAKEENLKLCFSKTIRYSDCDINRHMNNTRYIDMVCDINNSDFYSKYRISRLEINFNSEVYDGEVVDVFVNEDKTYIEGRTKEKLSFVARLAYTLR